MVDFYPILARAVSSLPHNDAEARRNLYARARAIVTEQLRGRALHGAAGEAIREQAALETAIRRVEAESRSGPTAMLRKPVAAPPPRKRGGVADAQERAGNTARSLSKILHAVQSDDTSNDGPQPSRRQSGTQALVPSAEPKALAMSGYRKASAPAELGGAPSSLGTMLFATAYVVAALAFTGVTYIRCIVWLYQDVIGYPILLVVMAATLGLFIVPPVMIFRKTSTLPTIDVLLRYIHSASRRVL